MALPSETGRKGVKAPKAWGKNKGFGVYRDKNGLLTYKGTKAAPQRPPGDGGAGAVKDATSAANTAATQRMADISGYYKELAGLLGGIGPGIESAYSDAAGDIAGFGQGFSGDFRDRMTANADATQGAVDRMTGNNLPPAVEEAARGGYDIGAAADVGYGLGAYLPAKSLREQGAAFGAAARFLPGSIAQQGLYALNAQAKAEAEAGASGSGAAKASASLSKALGYLVDSYGQPILNGKGKPIPIPKEGLTPYQQAQIEATKVREARYVDNENFDRWKAANDITFRNAQERRRIQADLRSGRQIDSAASKVRGFVVYKDGTVPRGKNGKPIPIAEGASESSPKAVATKKYQQAVRAARSAEMKGNPVEAPEGFGDGWYIAKAGMGKNVKDPWTGKSVYVTQNPAKARTDGMPWGQAVKYLQEAFGVTKAAAERALKSSGWVRPKVKPKPTNAYLDPTSSKRG
jgi:hypothetical protein